MTTRIIGTGHFVPEHIVTNDDLAQFLDTSDEWIKERTGIRRRHIDTGMGTTAMAAEASRRAIENAGISPKEIDLIIAATSTADEIFPNTAAMVQREIGNDRAACYDLNAACTGFIYGLNTAHAFISSHMAKTVLVVGSETMSRTVDWEDRSTCILFGDGAGAAVVAADDAGIEAVIMGSDGRKGEIIACDGRPAQSRWMSQAPRNPYMVMNGQEVFKFAVKKVPETIAQLLSQAGVGAEEVRHYILHQANERIIASVAKRLHVPMERFPINLGEYGNTSAASVPILLDELNRNGALKRGDRVVLAGFGAGLTWGATLMTW